MGLRKFWAGVRSAFAGVWSVALYDYNNGDPQLVGEYDWTDIDKYDLLIENYLTNGRDGVYFSCFKQGNNRGYFLVQASNGSSYSASYWDKTYYAVWAYKDAIYKCRDYCDALGFKRRVHEVA